jgi:hypothetical protein
MSTSPTPEERARALRLLDASEMYGLDSQQRNEYDQLRAAIESGAEEL